MIRLLLLVLVVFALAAGFAWLADHPGTITVNLGGYDITTTLMAAAIAILVVVMLIAIVWLLLRAVFRAPRAPCFGARPIAAVTLATRRCRRGSSRSAPAT